MNFKEWLITNEARLKGFKRIFQQANPEMPTYVQNDLYNTRSGHALSQLTKKYPSDLKQKYRSPEDIIPSDSVSKIFKAGGFKDIKWSPKPINLFIKPTDFSQKTLRTLKIRRFGFQEFSEIKLDLYRTMIQKRLLDKKTENEPVIILKTPLGYELLEGWHRTMNILLKGASPEQIKILKNDDDLSKLNLDSWKPVSILAYLGVTPEFSSDLPGTAVMPKELTNMLATGTAPSRLPPFKV